MLRPDQPMMLSVNFYERLLDFSCGDFPSMERFGEEQALQCFDVANRIMWINNLLLEDMWI